MRWSLRQQILSPLMLAGILLVYWLFDRLTVGRLADMDQREDQLVLAISQDLPGPSTSRDALAASLATLKSKYPGWEFVGFDGPKLLASTIVLSERDTDILFSVDIPPDFEACLCEDAESIQSAVVNLCLNALEAAGRHGRVRLIARTEGDETVVSVTDSGPGPAADVANTLFEPFVTTKPEGVGLGLVLVRQAVQDAGGSVHWGRESDETRFWIRLPNRAGVDGRAAVGGSTRSSISLER